MIKQIFLSATFFVCSFGIKAQIEKTSPDSAEIFSVQLLGRLFLQELRFAKPERSGFRLLSSVIRKSYPPKSSKRTFSGGTPKSSVIF